MKIEILKKKLLELNQMIGPILQESGYLETADLLSVNYDNRNADQIFLYTLFLGLMEHLDYIYDVLCYIKKPVAHEGIIRILPNGKYEIDGIEIQENDTFEILTLDNYTKMYSWEIVDFCKLYKKQDFDGKRARIRK